MHLACCGSRTLHCLHAREATLGRFLKRHKEVIDSTQV
jgi:hypothetical protein